MVGTNTAVLYGLLLMASTCTGSILPACDCSQALAAIQAKMEELEVSLSNQGNMVQNHESEIVSLTQNAESNQMNTNKINQMYLLLTTKVLTMENKISSMEQQLSAASDNKNVNDIQNATSLNRQGLLALEGKVQRHDQAILEHWKEFQNIKQTIEDHSVVITQQNQSIESHKVMLEDLNDTMEEHERNFRCCEELANCSRDVSTHTTEPTNAVSTISESTSAVPTTDVSTQKTPEPTNAVSTIGEPTSVVSTTESAVLPVRLVGGPGPYFGRAEVQYMGIWGTICEFGFTDSEAKVVCKALNYTGGRKVSDRRYVSRNQSQPIWLDNLHCVGSEQSLHMCSTSGYGPHGCRHSEDAVVQCDTPPEYTTQLPTSQPTTEGPTTPPTTPLTISTVKLVDSTSNSGAVAVEVQGKDYKLCDSDISLREAQVLCRAAGFNQSYPSKKIYGGALKSGEEIWPNQLKCSGHETSLEECTIIRQEGSVCTRRSTAFITCHKYSVRLINNDKNDEGRPVVFNNFYWGDVCKTDFDDEDATVLCRMMGYNKLARYLSKKSTYADDDFTLTKVNCTGKEQNINQCSVVTSGPALDDCHFSDAIYINCNPPDNPTRLVNGSHPGAGKLEMLHNGVWGAVCGSFFLDSEAKVACRDLGFPTEEPVSKVAHIQANTSFVVTDISCEGKEQHILECRHSYDVYFCRPNDNVYLECTPPPSTTSVKTTGQPTVTPRLNLTIASPNGSSYGPVAALPGGEALVADWGSRPHKVVRLDRHGRVVPPVFTCRTSYDIRGLVLDGDQLYVLQWAGRISLVQVSSLNITQAEWRVPGVGAWPWVFPGAVVGDELYLVHWFNGNAFSFNLVNQSKVVRTTGLSRPVSITTTTLHSPTRRLFIISDPPHVKVYNQSWSLTTTIGQGQLSDPRQVLVTPWSTILVADIGKYRVSEFSLSGGFIRHLHTSRDGLKEPYYISYSRPYLWVVHQTRRGGPHTVIRYQIVQ